LKKKLRENQVKENIPDKLLGDYKGLSKEDIRCRFTQRRRLEIYAQNRFGDEVEVRYLDRKIMLDQVEYSLIRTKDGSLAEELYQQVREGEAEFSQLSSAYSEGSERNNAGRIGDRKSVV
jgi:parvulin-like peptidyl-prolyl isomerase